MNQSELDRIIAGEDVNVVFGSLTPMLRFGALLTMYLVSLMTFGLSWWKAVLITLLIWFVMRIGFARGHLERLGVALFALTVVYWSDLLPLATWARGAIALVTRTLA